MWGLGLVMLSLLTIVIIGVISNISLTNQQDYYGVKQTSEAATYDSKNDVAYIKGICVCGQDKGTNIKYSYLESVDLGDYKWKNTSAIAGSEGAPYTVSLVDENGKCESPNPNFTKCEARIGEYVIDPDVFTESVIARLGSIIKPSEVYDIIVQEVIPYPPKISVYISYHQALNNGGDAINAEIPNQIDAVIEDTGSQAVIEYKHNNLPEFSASCVKEYCYMDEQEWKYCDSNDEQTCKNSGFTKKVEVTSSLVCGNACFCRDNGLDCGYYAKDKSWTGWKQVDSSKCNQAPPAEPELTKEPEIPPSTGGSCTWHNNKTLVTCKKTASCATKNYAACGCDAIHDSSGKAQCERGCSICASCTEPARLSSGKCEIVELKWTKAIRGFNTCDAAEKNCKAQAEALCPTGYTVSYKCHGWQGWSGTRNNKNKTPFSFSNSCTSSHSCSEYSPYKSCICEG